MARIIAFIMDPMDQVQPLVDTTFAFMLAAQARGFEILHIAPTHVGLVHTEVFLSGQRVAVVDSEENYCRFEEKVRVAARDCDAIFIRTNPPFDEAYLRLTWLLGFAERAGVRIINSPSGIRAANEKLYALEFPEFCPATIVTSDQGEALAFVDSQGGHAIAKPLDGFGGYGVVQLRIADYNLKALIDILTMEGKQSILIQTFVPDAHGDKRLLFVDGALRGAISRLAPEGDHRGNVHVGGTVMQCDIDEHDRRIAAAVGQRFREDGLFFVGLDVIEGYLIEVNVTSPTLIRELKSLGGPDLAADVIDRLV